MHTSIIYYSLITHVPISMGLFFSTFGLLCIEKAQTVALFLSFPYHSLPTFHPYKDVSTGSVHIRH